MQGRTVPAPLQNCEGRSGLSLPLFPASRLPVYAQNAGRRGRSFPGPRIPPVEPVERRPLSRGGYFEGSGREHYEKQGSNQDDVDTRPSVPEFENRPELYEVASPEDQRNVESRPRSAPASDENRTSGIQP